MGRVDATVCPHPTKIQTTEMAPRTESTEIKRSIPARRLLTLLPPPLWDSPGARLPVWCQINAAKQRRHRKRHAAHARARIRALALTVQHCTRFPPPSYPQASRLVSSMVLVHRGMAGMGATPRQYMGFVQLYGSIYANKRKQVRAKGRPTPSAPVRDGCVQLYSSACTIHPQAKGCPVPSAPVREIAPHAPTSASACATHPKCACPGARMPSICGMFCKPVWPPHLWGLLGAHCALLWCHTSVVVPKCGGSHSPCPQTMNRQVMHTLAHARLLQILEQRFLTTGLTKLTEAEGTPAAPIVARSSPPHHHTAGPGAAALPHHRPHQAGRGGGHPLLHPLLPAPHHLTTTPQVLEQQRFLTTGLTKLAEAEGTVDELSANAGQQRELLKAKQAEAEEALVRIQASMMQVMDGAARV